MCRVVPISGLVALLLSAAAAAQTPPQWRRVGPAAYHYHLASPAGGPVERVWFSADGGRLFARTGLGQIYETTDFLNWQPSAATEPPEPPGVAAVERSPSEGARTVAAGSQVYAFGDHVYRSEDGGASWLNLTAFRAESVIGRGQRSLAVSPSNPDEVVVANGFGVWRSLDGGLSWTGLNESLPNLRPLRIVSTPAAGKPMQIVVEGAGILEFLPGSMALWQPARAAGLENEAEVMRAAATVLGTELTAIARTREILYAGAADGRLFASLDGGRTWPLVRPGNGQPVRRIFSAGRLALAAAGTQLLRTTNAGAFWDDVTGNLGGAVFGVTADPSANVVFAATARGLFMAQADLQNASLPQVNWARVAGLPEAPVRDAALDPARQLYVALEGFGIYAAAAPHRGGVRIVNAADYSSRAAAPGSLLTVQGARVTAADSGVLRFPVLAATEQESQLQVPFEIAGPEVALSIETGGTRASFPLAVQPASPAIFVGHDGIPMLLDGDTGLLLDPNQGARSNGRIQILATGLGRVRPQWPTGLAAPLQDPPTVDARVAVYLDRVPLTVTRAILAPGYIGFYLVEVQLPGIVNAGPAELYLSLDGQESNRVQVYLEP